MRTLLAAGIGFGLVFPSRIVEGVNVRLSDVVASLLACVALMALATRASRGRSIEWPYLAIAMLTLGWIGADFTFRAYLPVDPSVSMILVRWLVALPSAYYLAVLTQEQTFRKWFVVGVVVGCLATNATTLSDLMTYRLTGHPQFLLDNNTGLVRTDGYADYRAGGILGAPNGASISGLFIVPFLIGAAEEFGCYLLALAVSVPTICVIFYATQSRGAMLVSFGLLLLWGLLRQPALVLRLFVIGTVLGGLIAIVNPGLQLPGNGDDGLLGLAVSRFTDEATMGGNMSDRVGTTVASLELVLKHPFGMGSTYEAPMDQLTGYDATHNALTQLALMAGLPLAVLITVMLLDTARKVFLGRHRIQYWVAVYVLGVSMFESAFFIPFFSVITLWLIAQPTACAAGSEQSGLHSLDAERSSRIPAHEVILR